MAANNSNSLLGNRQPTLSTTASNNKRKATDPNLKIITIDELYDVTLIVGTPDHPNGQMAFRINKGSLRNATKVWAKMLSGDWAESDMSEIPFTDDSCFAFQIVLQIAHLQFHELPTSLTLQKLMDVATLADKYELARILRPVTETKKWLQPHRVSPAVWRTSTAIQEFAFITETLGSEDDLKYLINKLAMNVRIDIIGGYYPFTSDGTKDRLRLDLLDRISAQVISLRMKILEEILNFCKNALHNVVTRKVARCKQTSCPIGSIGILIQTFNSAGLFPLPDKTSSMGRSVCDYWLGLRELTTMYNNYGAQYCKITTVVNNRQRSACFGDFGIVGETRAVLKKYAHKDVWAQWKVEKLV
ncbi:hypothetical protein P153DRAFT_430299 [Dothidotthia symphoricarpi CBS 119687]|uniref:BTB domain-containing protein n=1 Tax=Dothidotthia symphoricarpi CBS 119687 TaxID=1392245 RepID=A0A6A6AGC6_9PLEO|nr:uncharacterized protein P153DRAFT_430299 [Dothidotthia symphoricarpi CBS 119687]KAF2131042.1 hypothetical protein P153DRAFT_430299 [Dothidotthia symphoricarpi CBS 119687]